MQKRHPEFDLIQKIQGAESSSLGPGFNFYLPPPPMFILRPEQSAPSSPSLLHEQRSAEDESEHDTFPGCRRHAMLVCTGSRVPCPYAPALPLSWPCGDLPTL